MRLCDLFEDISSPSFAGPDLPKRERGKIITAMMRHVRTNRHWDDHAKKRHPDKFRGVTWDEFGDGMADEWGIDRYEESQQDAFLTRLRQWAEERYDFVVNKLKSEPEREGGMYKIARIMFVPHYQIKEWSKNRNRKLDPNSPSNWGRSGISLGLHWTYDLHGWNGDDDDGARAVWSRSNGYIGADLLIEALAPPTSIDWPTTIMSNMDYFSGDKEREIRIIQDAPLHVQKISIWDEQNIAKAQKMPTWDRDRHSVDDYFGFKFDAEGDVIPDANTITFKG